MLRFYLIIPLHLFLHSYIIFNSQNNCFNINDCNRHLGYHRLQKTRTVSKMDKNDNAKLIQGCFHCRQKQVLIEYTKSRILISVCNYFLAIVPHFSILFLAINLKAGLNKSTTDSIKCVHSSAT